MIMILTYLYYAISYYIEYKFDITQKLNSELFILVCEVLTFRYAINLIDDDMIEFI